MRLNSGSGTQRHALLQKNEHFHQIVPSETATKEKAACLTFLSLRMKRMSMSQRKVAAAPVHTRTMTSMFDLPSSPGETRKKYFFFFPPRSHNLLHVPICVCEQSATDLPSGAVFLLHFCSHHDIEKAGSHSEAACLVCFQTWDSQIAAQMVFFIFWFVFPGDHVSAVVCL